MDRLSNERLLHILREISTKTPQRAAHDRAKNRERAKLEGSREYCKRQLNRIFVRDRGICQICLGPALDPSRDHIISLAEYKENPELCSLEYLRSDENVRLACADCNGYTAREVVYRQLAENRHIDL